MPGDTNGHADAFLRDRQTGTTILISKGYNGAQADGDSRRPVVSRDGQYVAFESAADNLVPPGQCTTSGGGGGLLGGLFGGPPKQTCTGGDTNKADDVFLYSVATGQVTPISTAPDGTLGNGASNRPSLSGNGHEIAFQSTATNLVSGVGGTQVYMRNLDTGQITVVSSDASGTPGDKSSESPSVSADGRYVSFDSKATTFNSADAGGDVDVYRKDLQTGAVDQASVLSGGAQATGTTGSSHVGSDSTISQDGRFVSFWSDVNTLVPGDTNGSNCANPPCTDVFVHNMQTGTTTRITSTNGVQGDGDSYSPALSMDGRFVAIDSKASTLDPSAAANNVEDIYVHVNY